MPAVQIIHRRVEHDEAVSRRLFLQNNRCEQHAGRTDQPAARFQRHSDIEVVERRFDRSRQCVGTRPRIVAVWNAEAAAAIDDPHAVALIAQYAHQFGHAGEGGTVRCQFHDLAADMGGETDRLDRWQRSGFSIERHGVGPGDAEFIAARPVEILSWVLASTSGLIRSATLAVRPIAAAIADSVCSSSALSMLIWPMSSASARRSSASVLPTPE